MKIIPPACLDKFLADSRLLGLASWRSSRRELLRFSRDRLARSLILGGIAVSFEVAVFVICFLAFSVFLSLDELGWLVVGRLGEYGLVILFFMMLYSSLLTTLYALFSDRTLPLLWTCPVGLAALWWNRVSLVVARSGWMVVGFALPVLLALGVAAGSPPAYYLAIPAAVLGLGVLSCALGMGLGLLLVFFLPPRRVQQALLLFGVMAGMLAVVAFQQMRLDRLLSEGDAAATGRQLLALRRLPPPLGAPIGWSSDLLLSSAAGRGAPLLPLLKLLALDALFLAGLHLLGLRLFFSAWSRNLAAPGFAARRLASPAALFSRLPLARLGGPLLCKDFRLFFRELEQWSSLVMVLPMLLLCIFNMRLIFAQLTEPQALLGWINLILCGLVVAGVGARVLYPCFSVEGPAFWNTLVAPTRLSRLLWSKFTFYSFPLVGTALLLTTLNNLIFRVPAPQWGLSLFTSGLAALTLCAIGMAFAATFPQFQYRQVSQVVLSMGGLYYMLAAFAYVAAVSLLWSLPFLARMPEAYVILGAYAKLETGPWLLAGAALSLGTLVICMRVAHRALLRLEWTV